MSSRASYSRMGWLLQDPRRIRVAGLFDADGRYIEGNIESLPPGLRPEVPTSVAVFRFDSRGRELQRVRVIAHLLPNGHVFVIGRNIDEIVEIADIVRQTLVLGLLPAFVAGDDHRNGIEPACSR